MGTSEDPTSTRDPMFWQITTTLPLRAYTRTNITRGFQTYSKTPSLPLPYQWKCLKNSNTFLDTPNNITIPHWLLPCICLPTPCTCPSCFQPYIVFFEGLQTHDPFPTQSIQNIKPITSNSSTSIPFPIRNHARENRQVHSVRHHYRN